MSDFTDAMLKHPYFAGLEQAKICTCSHCTKIYGDGNCFGWSPHCATIHGIRSTVPMRLPHRIEEIWERLASECDCDKCRNPVVCDCNHCAGKCVDKGCVSATRHCESMVGYEHGKFPLLLPHAVAEKGMAWDLFQDYVFHADLLLSEWVSRDFPETVTCHSMPLGSVVPWPHLVCRERPQKPDDIFHRQAHGGSFTVFPEIHFWHTDGRLVVFEGVPSSYSPVSMTVSRDGCESVVDLKKDNPFPEATQAGLEIINRWMTRRDDKGDDRFSCCGWFNSDDEQWDGKVYAHSHDISDGGRRPQLFPQLGLSNVAERTGVEAHNKLTIGTMTAQKKVCWYDITFKPTEYDLFYVGTFKPVMESVPDNIWEAVERVPTQGELENKRFHGRP